MSNSKSNEQVMLNQENKLKAIRIEKVVVNIGVGQSGDKLEKAKTVLKRITSAKPCERRALDTIREFNVRKGEPIAAMVTLRRQTAEDFLTLAMKSIYGKLNAKSFSGRTFSFGIKEHINLPGIKYDPSVGIFGMDVCVSLERPGFRVAKRRRRKSKVGRNHIIKTEESISFIIQKFNVEVN